MCGIFGYSGTKKCKDEIFDGLKRLEYRGYDSWGIAILIDSKIYQYKNIGEITKEKDFEKLKDGTIGIGHTRWATHGGVTQKNAHPHLSSNNEFTLVQNGIVENFDSLKNELLSMKKIFKSETDTEVIVKMIEQELAKKRTIKESIITVFNRLEGRNTIVILDSKTGKIYGIRNGSPLVIGMSDDGTYLASDTLSFSKATNRVVLLDDYDMVEIEGRNIEIWNVKEEKIKEVVVKELKHQFSEIDKGDFQHFMLKEIVDQKKTILFSTKYSQKELKPLLDAVKEANRVYTLGAGTAGFAAGQVAYFLRNIASIDAHELKSYEYRSYLPIITKNDLIIAFSQSGETADSIEAIEELKKRGCKVASIVNMFGTTISRISDYEYYTNSGPEICVASTKVFTAQCAWGYLLAMSVFDKFKEAKNNIKRVSKELNQLYENNVFEQCKKIGKLMKGKEHAFILGKGENFCIALEGALKIKEISYKHVEGFAAGELKHGVIALIEKGTVVFGILPNSRYPESNDLISAMEQVKARGAYTIGVGSKEFEMNDLFDMYITTPQVENISSIGNVIPFQLISYFLSVELGNNIDKPRNLAKSVTVK